MYYKKGWPGGNIVLRNSVGDEGEEWGAQTKGVFASNSIDSCTGLELNEYLVKAKLYHDLHRRRWRDRSCGDGRGVTPNHNPNPSSTASRPSWWRRVEGNPQP